MPCTFHLDDPLRELGPGCQFGIPEDELIKLKGEMWCEFHLPLKGVKAKWNEAQIKVFNEKIFGFIDKAKKDGKTADLSGVVFPGPISFDRYADKSNDLPGVRFFGALFNGDARFEGATFRGDAGFEGATFRGDAGFEGATFGGDAGFDETTFSGAAQFHRVTFRGIAWFREATFGGIAWFHEATFGGLAWFHEATFSSVAGFGGATFSGDAAFHGATFSDIAQFHGATFGGDAGFEGATFSDDANFSGSSSPPGDSFLRVTFAGVNFNGQARFTNRHFLESTDFGGGLFKKAPEFHNCSLHQDTNFDGRQFEDHSSEAVRAYRTLKLAMEKVRSWTERARFFAYEQQSLRAHPDTPHWVKLFSRLYEITANYGQSCMRPVAWFAGTFAVFFLVYLAFKAKVPITWADIGDVARFGLQQIFRPFQAFSPTHKDSIPLILALLAALHSVLNFSFLTLFILALRRRFKIG